MYCTQVADFAVCEDAETDTKHPLMIAVVSIVDQS